MSVYNQLYEGVQIAKPGKESEVEAFLKKQAALASGEPATLTWCAAKEEGKPGVFQIFDTYDDEAGRQAHLNGEAGKELVAAVQAGELFAEAPKIYMLQVVAEN